MIFGGIKIRISLNIKSLGTEKSNFSPKGPMALKICDMKLWLLLTKTMQKFSVLLCLLLSYS